MQRQPGLPDPARTGQRDEPVLGEQAGDPCGVVVATDDRRRRRRQLVGRCLQAAQRREPGRQAVGDQLVERLGCGQVLEPVGAQRDGARPVRPVPLQEGLGRPGQQDLPAVAGGGDPRDPVHVHPDVAVAGRRPLAGVDADPDPHLPPAGPGVGGQAALHRDRRLHRVDGRAEDAEEGVALGRPPRRRSAGPARRARSRGGRGGDGRSSAPRSASSLVDPSMSVMQKVTVPVGRPTRANYAGTAARRPLRRTVRLPPGHRPGVRARGEVEPRPSDRVIPPVLHVGPRAARRAAGQAPARGRQPRAGPSRVAMSVSIWA